MILRQLSNLQQRLVISSIGIISLLVAISLSYTYPFQLLFFLLAAAIIGAALWEYYDIAKAKGYVPLIKIGLLGSIAYLLAVFVRTQTDNATMFPEIALAVTFISAFTYYFIKGSDPFSNLAITLFGIVYITIPLSCLIAINYFSSGTFVTDGRWCLVYLLFVTKMTDAVAYFVGKRYGQRKLSPYISPKKTWEGALGGLLGAVVTSLILYACFNLFFANPPFNLTLWQSIWLAVLISVAGQFGDLAESLLKRDVGIKDSSSIPGLGGILDIMDSLVFTSPLMYIFLKVMETTS